MSSTSQLANHPSFSPGDGCRMSLIRTSAALIGPRHTNHPPVQSLLIGESYWRIRGCCHHRKAATRSSSRSGNNNRGQSRGEAVLQQSTPVLYKLQLLSTCPVQRNCETTRALLLWHCQFPQPALFIHSFMQPEDNDSRVEYRKLQSVVVPYLRYSTGHVITLMRRMRYSTQITIAPKCHTW